MDRENAAPLAYENWQLADAGEELQIVEEYPLFADAHITDEILEGFGPYKLLNTPAIPPDTHNLAPRLILRVESYRKYEPAAMDETNIQSYHGGALSDEIAALVSLILGIRLRAGGVTRCFRPNGDPKGHPVGLWANDVPVLTKTPSRRPILPYALRTHDLGKIRPFQKLTNLSPQEAVALVRAARLYQDAMWLGESSPELSWIMFVSAAEVAASHWHTDQDNGLEMLVDWKPDFVEQLQALGGQKAVQLVADEFADYLRSAKKFRDFVSRFLPEPPKERPEQYRVSWKARDITQAMVKIYEYRSRALHSGIPFPQPMCEPPMHLEEKPLGLGAGVNGAFWVTKDTPMHLHIFEYIIRKALLKWWESMLVSCLAG